MQMFAIVAYLVSMVVFAEGGSFLDRTPQSVKGMRSGEAPEPDEESDVEDLSPPREHKFNMGLDVAMIFLPMFQIRPFVQVTLTDRFALGMTPIFWIFVDPTSQIGNIANRPRSFFFGVEARATYFFSGNGFSSGFRIDGGPELIFLPQVVPSLVSSQHLYEVFFYYGGFVSAAYQYFFDNGLNASIGAGVLFKRMTDYQFAFYVQPAGFVEGRLEVRLGFAL
jgi:hypothetical protein